MLAEKPSLHMPHQRNAQAVSHMPIPCCTDCRVIYAQAAASITTDTLTAAAVDTSYLSSLLATMDTMRTVVLALAIVTVVAVLALCVVHALRTSGRSSRGGE